MLTPNPRAPREFTPAENEFVAAMIKEAGDLVTVLKDDAPDLAARIEDAIDVTAIGWQNDLPGAIDCARALRQVVLAYGLITDAELANLPA